MAWSAANRAAYERGGQGFPSDPTRNGRLAQSIPPAKPGGRPRETDMRAALDGLLYLLRTGCPWRFLPRGRFPPARR